jgi:hypothetical protein
VEGAGALRSPDDVDRRRWLQKQVHLPGVRRREVAESVIRGRERLQRRLRRLTVAPVAGEVVQVSASAQTAFSWIDFWRSASRPRLSPLCQTSNKPAGGPSPCRSPKRSSMSRASASARSRCAEAPVTSWASRRARAVWGLVAQQAGHVGRAVVVAEHRSAPGIAALPPGEVERL